MSADQGELAEPAELASADAEWTAGFVAALGIELWTEDDATHGRAEVRPGMFAAGSDSPRLGVLATLVDVAAGCPPSGALNPTVDLRVTLLAPPPSEGTILLRCDPAKFGRRLFVGETVLHTGDLARPFARSVCTFMNQRIGEPGQSFGSRTPVPPGAPSFEQLLNPRRVEAGVLTMDAHPGVSNGPGGTIQGGAQALLAELAAEDALAAGGRYEAIDLEIRYLNRVRASTVTATSTVYLTGPDTATVRVAISDADEERRLVSLVAVNCRKRLD